MTRIALLGCGRIGRMHAEIIAAHPRATLAGVFDTHSPSSEEVAVRLGVLQYDSPEAAFASDADAVLTTKHGGGGASDSGACCGAPGGLCWLAVHREWYGHAVC